MKNNLYIFLNNLKRHFILYILVIVLIPFLVINVANKKTEINRKQTLNFFFVTDTFNGDAFMERVKYSYQEYNIIQSKTFKDSPINDKIMFNQYLEAYGILQSDFMIIPSSILTETFISTSLKPFKDNRPSDLKLKDKSYGIRLYDHINKTSYLSDYMNTEYQEEDYYLTISTNCYHYNEYNNNDNSLLSSIIKDLTK